MFIQYEMPSILHLITLCVLIPRYSEASRYHMKPLFPNYCEAKDKCKPACNCEVYPNCSLLAMDETVRKTILFYHNQIRDIQSAGEPQPAGMPMLQYDMQLEEISKCWAARCDNEYSVCFKTPRFPETSQSVGGLILEGEESPNVFLWLQMMSYWLGQAEVVPTQAIYSLPSDSKHESMHNFAQLMSDNVLSVGCAWSILTTDNWLIFVCTYGPRGPIEGEAIYKTGYPCSHCPEDYACDYVKPFERLCKRNTDEPVPPSSYPSVRREEPSQKDDRKASTSPPQQIAPSQQGLKTQKTLQNRNFNEQNVPGFNVTHIVRTLTDYPPMQYSTQRYPQMVQEYARQEYPKQTQSQPSQPKLYQNVPKSQPSYPPAKPSYSPSQPSYPPAQPPYASAQPSYPQAQPSYPPAQPPYPQAQPSYPPAQPSYPPAQPPYATPQPGYYPNVQLTSSVPQQFPQYIPQPPPLPRVAESFQVPSEKFAQPYTKFQSKPPVPPPPSDYSIQGFYRTQQRQPILPPPPQEENFESIMKSQYGQAVPPNRIPNKYFSLAPPIPQPPPIDLPPSLDSKYYLPAEYRPNLPPPPAFYDAQGRRIFFPDVKSFFRYPEVALQTSSIPKPPEAPSQHNRAIVLPHAEPLPPPLSYFPPQPPPLPRGESDEPAEDEGDSPLPPPLPHPSELPPYVPPTPPPPIQMTSIPQQEPDSSQYSYSVQPYEVPKNPQGVPKRPHPVPQTRPPGPTGPQSQVGPYKQNPSRSRTMVRKSGEFGRRLRSKGLLMRGHIEAMIVCDIFIVILMQ